ncbi:uncharacterized protein (UPF0179 family) [Methanomicrobium sp. W14]|uniref:UPF0179 family protein n=1 Tax=Methanomicrobium sp. W14 TaxID=2817839 RepID=UPI001AEA4115|nr:UPF0179 family protein [Methanomicrobium sp. W14]MBP2132774.1 uncharacterized protein (UPF0179 family) [Methanomicrobium sp. W14]
MSENQTRITLIGKLLSKPGLEFIYKGELPECEGCRMFKVCNNLVPKRRYRVTGLKNDTVHSCNIHYGGVCAVEVVEAPVAALVDSKKAILNSEISYEPSCTEAGCKNYDLCLAEGLSEGERYLVSSVSDSQGFECLRGKTLKKVELSPLDD